MRPLRSYAFSCLVSYDLLLFVYPKTTIARYTVKNYVLFACFGFNPQTNAYIVDTV